MFKEIRKDNIKVARLNPGYIERDFKNKWSYFKQQNASIKRHCRRNITSFKNA